MRSHVGRSTLNRKLRKDYRMPPRVLFLDHTAELGGAELCLLEFVTSATGRELIGAKVVLFADGPLLGRLKAAGVAADIDGASKAVLAVRRDAGIASLGSVLTSIAGQAVRLSRLARRFDLIYANSQKAFVVGSLAAALARKPLIWHLHDILTAEHFGGTQRALVVFLANRFATVVVANSNATAEAFVASGGRRSKLAVVYNGVDPKMFGDRDPAECRGALRRELNISGDAFVVGCFSRLAHWKGQHVLLRALAAVKSVHAILVGSPLFGEEAYAEGLRRTVTELGLQDRVHFLGFRPDIADLLLGVDVAVHCSVSPEPFGRVIIEAMLARKPVIASATGGASEIVTNEVNALVVPSGDASALAQAIERLSEGPPKLSDALTRRGHEDATSRFSLDAFAHGIDQAIRRATPPTA
jgi:glycosyltransferase involved in cell wall biosynthesis